MKLTKNFSLTASEFLKCLHVEPDSTITFKPYFEYDPEDSLDLMLYVRPRADIVSVIYPADYSNKLIADPESYTSGMYINMCDIPTSIMDQSLQVLNRIDDLEGYEDYGGLIGRMTFKFKDLVFNPKWPTHTEDTFLFDDLWSNEDNF